MGPCGFDLGRSLIRQFKTLFIGIEILSVSNVEVIASRDACCRREHKGSLQPPDAYGWLTSRGLKAELLVCTIEL
jgi:hypothetical protein